MNNQLVQKSDNAGKTRLTAVTIGHARGKKQVFVELYHNDKGEAILPMVLLNKILSGMNIPASSGYTITTG